MIRVKKPEDVRSLQDVFDLAVTRVLQNQQPAYYMQADCCAYRADHDGHVAVCAVGALIPDDHYMYCREGESVKRQDPKVFSEPMQDLLECDDTAWALLELLQEAHDVLAEKWAKGEMSRSDFQVLFRHRAEGIAYRLSLSTDALYDA